LFICALFYNVMNDSSIIVNNFPHIKQRYREKNWVKYFEKCSKDIDYLKLLDYYYNYLRSLIVKDEASFCFWFTGIFNCWISYLYPSVYTKYAIHLKSDKIPLPGGPLKDIGIHPFCPMAPHVTSI